MGGFLRVSSFVFVPCLVGLWDSAAVSLMDWHDFVCNTPGVSWSEVNGGDYFEHEIDLNRPDLFWIMSSETFPVVQLALTGFYVQEVLLYYVMSYYAMSCCDSRGPAEEETWKEKKPS